LEVVVEEELSVLTQDHAEQVVVVPVSSDM
jgi:hypothetical protein